MRELFRCLPSRLGRCTVLAMAGLGVLLGSAATTLAQVSTLSATTLKAVKAARGPDATEIDGTTPWSNVPGASLTFTVPAGETNVFVMRYTAESVCFGGAGWCSVRMLENGTEATPTVGTDFAFDSTDGGAASSEGWKGHAVDRSKSVTNKGTSPLTVTVVVQYITTDPTIYFRLDDWQFTVEQFE